MKKSLFLLLSACFLTGFSAENLIQNPSFEEVSSDGKLVKWHSNQAKGLQDITFKVEHGVCTDGKNCATIIAKDPNTATNHFVAWIQDFDPKKLAAYAGQAMMLSFDYSTDAPGTTIRAYVEGQVNGKGFNRIGPTKSNYVGWTKYQYVFQMPKEKPRFMYLVLQLHCSGRVSFDNVVLCKAPEQAVQAAAAPKPVVKAAPKKIRLDVRFRNMPPKNIFIKEESPRKIGLQAFMGDEKFSGMTAEIKDIRSGKVLAGKYFPTKGGELNAVWDFPELPVGVYRLECSAKMLDKIYTESTLFRIAAKKEVEAYPVRFREDHIMVFRGEPFFPIIVCPPFTTKEAYQAYQAAGFNTLCPHCGEVSGSSPEGFYQLAADYGLHLIEWRNAADGGAGSMQAMEDSFGHLRRNATLVSNFLGIMDDEEAWRNISEEKVKRTWEAFYIQAPGYLYWSNQAPRGTVDYLRNYTRNSDVTGADVYPIPAKSKHSEMPRQNIACLGDYTDHSMQAGDQARPVWMILQAWSWGGPQGSADKPMPTFDELRFMFYNSITHGATGIAWFDNNTLDPQNPLMPHLSKINHEFWAISKYITHGKADDSFELAPHSDGICLMEREWNGKHLLIAVNENEQPVTATVFNRKNLSLIEVGEKTTLSAQPELKIDIPKLGVRIFCTEPVSYTWAKTFGKLAPKPKPIPLQEAIRTKKDGEVIDWRGRFIWDSTLVQNKDYSRTTMQTKFRIKGAVRDSWLVAGADNQAAIRINGKQAFAVNGWDTQVPMNIASFLKDGENVLEIELINHSGPGGLIYEGEITTADGTVAIYSSENDRFLDKSGKPTVKPVVYDSPKSKVWGSVSIRHKR